MRVRILITTVANRKQAERLANSLIDRKLAACVSIMPSIRSHYVWKGRRHSSAEALVLIKTYSRLWKKIYSLLSELHPYEVPELLEVPVGRVGSAYLDWMKNVLK